MKRIANPELDRVILDHLAEKYQLYQHRKPGEFHLSTAVYCLTRGFFEATAPIAPTDEEVMLFALGFGLQDILTPSSATTPTFTKDGVIYRPDFVLSIEQDEYHELKTTRMSMRTILDHIPESWEEYIAGGCFMRGVKVYHLSTLLMMGTYAPPFPLIYSEDLIFEEEELAGNWSRLIKRKEVYDEAIKTGTPPVPFMYCKEWECKNCRYSTMCNAILLLSKRKQEAT